LDLASPSSLAPIEEKLSQTKGPFARNAWSLKGVLVVFCASILAFWIVDSVVVLLLAWVTHRDIASVSKAWFLLRRDYSFFGPGVTTAVVVARGAAALFVIYALRGWLPVSSPEEFGLRRVSAPDVIISVGIAPILLIVSLTIAGIERSLLPHHHMPINFWNHVIASHPGSLSFAVYTAQGAILAPLSEEPIFRGLLFVGLAQRMPLFWAALISGLIFGAFHLNLASLLPIAAIGTGNALLYYWRRNLWTPMITHGTANLALFLAPLIFALKH
jgi:membrane protease YdiL (CAAX protease family)